MGVHATCDTCYRSSPSVNGPLSDDDGRGDLRRLGWSFRPDGSRLCPICSARVSTLPPPPSQPGEAAR